MLLQFALLSEISISCTEIFALKFYPKVTMLVFDYSSLDDIFVNF